AVAVAEVVEPEPVSSPAAAAKSRPERPKPCPASCSRCDDEGRCLTLWEREEPPATPSVSGCGDGRCDPGESEDTCCRDCGCTPPLECRRDRGERDVCAPARLWSD